MYRVHNRITAVLQGIMQETQRRIMVKQNQFMRRPLGQEQMIKELEKEQAIGIDQMIKALDLYKPLYLWQPMLKKQVNTMRMMFCYQKREFDQVDVLLKNCLLMDAQSISMKMARMFVNKHYYQDNRPFRDDLIDELGDVLWYVAETAAGLGIKLEDIAQHNVEKLKKRYPEGFDPEKSLHREE